MRIDDIYVEVRGKKLDGSGTFLDRQGTILNRDLNLKAKTRWCGVGEWELTLPGTHPMVPYLMQPGSGLVVSGPVDRVLHPSTYSAWTETRRNYHPNPVNGGAVSGGLAPGNSAYTVGASAGTYEVVAGWQRILTSGIAAGGRNGYMSTIPVVASAGTPIHLRLQRESGTPLPAGVRARLYVDALVAGGSTIVGHWDGYFQTDGVGDVLTASITPTGNVGSLRWYVWLEPDPSSGSFAGTARAGFSWAGIELGAPIVNPFYGDSNSGGELTRTRWDGAANASPSVMETREKTSDPYYQDVFGTLFSGPTLVPHRKRDIRNPDGTLTFKGVTDEVHLEDAMSYPSPAVADEMAQTRANDDQTGKAETLLRYYVNANIVSAPAARKGGFRNLIDLAGSDMTRGATVSKSPRFQNLLELLQEIAATSLIGFRMVQVGNRIQFQVVPTRDLRKSVRLDIESGTLNAEETQVDPWSLTRAITAGQGEGTARKILRVTTPESLASEVTSGRIIERWVNQSNSNEDAVLTTKGLEELADAAGGLAVKAVPADATTMVYGFEWREGDWITVIVDGEELDSVVTEAVFSFTKDLVGVGVAVGDVSSFQRENKERKQSKSLDSRVSYIERAIESATKKIVRHAEFTGTMSVANGGSPSPIPALPRDTARTSDTSVATPTSGGFSVGPGTYVVYVSAAVTGVSPLSGLTRAFVNVSDDLSGQSTRPASVQGGEDQMAGSVTIYMPTAGKISLEVYQASGASRTTNIRVKITALN